MALIAVINEQADRETDRRSEARRPVALAIEGWSRHGQASALIHNLSRDGFLLEAECPLTLGQQIVVSLPVAGEVQATVVRIEGNFAGCKLSQRLPRAALSAAVLQSPFDQLDQFSMVSGQLPNWTGDEPDGQGRAPVGRAITIAILVAFAIVVAAVLRIVALPLN